MKALVSALHAVQTCFCRAGLRMGGDAPQEDTLEIDERP